MPKITTEKEFLERAEHCAHCLEKKFKCEPGHRAIVLCGETGCLANGSQELLDEFLKLIKENKLEDKVTANIVSCFGLCSQGPFVKVFPEETLYTKVQLKDVKEIIEKDVIGGEVVERLLYVDPQTKEKRRTQEEIGFYKLQTSHFALRGNGKINPLDFDEA